MTAGHLRQRSAGSFELRWRAGGKVCTRTIKGGAKDAQKALRAALTAVDKGEHVEPSSRKVAEHVRGRIEQWQAGGRISGPTADSYRVALVRISSAALGDIPLQRLSTLDIEAWHGEMHQQGPRTRRAAHMLLARALNDAVKHRLMVRNAAREQGAPIREPSPRVTAPNSEQVKSLLANLASDPWRTPVTVALYRACAGLSSWR
jgi:hypothetical protein